MPRDINRARERLVRSLETWAGIKPEAISGCSPAHITNLVRDAQRDIATLAAALATAREEGRAEGEKIGHAAGFAECRERAAWVATSFLVGDPQNGIPLRSPSPRQIADKISALTPSKEG